MTYDLLTIGDIKLDTFVIVPEASVFCSLKEKECQLCLAYGEKIPMDVIDSQIAGSATNVAVGLSRMGLKTGIVSVMGKDGTRKMAFELLKREHVDTRFIETNPKAESTFSVVLTFKGEKTILATHVKRNYRLPEKNKPRWLYLSELGDGYEHLFLETAGYVKRHGVQLGFNPGAVQIRERKKALWTLLKQTAVLFMNVEEAQMLLGEKSRDVRLLAEGLKALGATYAVITDGKAGAYGFDGNMLTFCPTFPGKLVGATGAGDAFATGFLGALLHKQSPETALRWGAVDAASVVGYIGPQKGLLTLKELKRRLKSFDK